MPHMDIGVTLYFVLLGNWGRGKELESPEFWPCLSLVLPLRISPEQVNSMALNKHAINRLTVLAISLLIYKMRNLGVVDLWFLFSVRHFTVWG